MSEGMNTEKGKQYLLNNGEISHPVAYDSWSSYALREATPEECEEYKMFNSPMENE